jgi:diaminopimelate epimerase
MEFTKMQGAGNDYIYVNGFTQEVPDPAALAVQMSDRHFGVGADGLIVLRPSEQADFAMEMYNADGSRGAMCGNGIRCAVRFALDEGIAEALPVSVQTLSGVRQVYKLGTHFCVDMGAYALDSTVKPELSGVKGVAASLGVNVGNPHFVLMVSDLKEICLEKDGPAIARSPVFPDGVNVEFVQVVDETHLRMQVWERGSGRTLACGTGTCAAAITAWNFGFCKERVMVDNPGGTLEVRRKNNTLWLLGPADYVFRGTWET